MAMVQATLQVINTMVTVVAMAMDQVMATATVVDMAMVNIVVGMITTLVIWMAIITMADQAIYFICPVLVIIIMVLLSVINIF